MSGTSLDQFNSFVAATGSTYVDGPTGIINDSTRKTFWLNRFLDGSELANKKMIRGGKTIKNNIIFRDNGTFTHYQPGANQDWKNPQRLQAAETYWRFALAHMSWVNVEILLNDLIKYGDADVKYHQFASIRDEKEMAMWSSKYDGMEASMWRQPDVTRMEGDGSTQDLPYSIPLFINEHANGLYPSYTPGGAWTTIEGLDPTDAEVDGQWTCQQNTYGSATAGSEDNLVGAMDQMFMDLEFQQPPSMREYYENPAFSKQIIATSTTGRRAYMNLLRQGQDHFVMGPQDPAYSDPQFHGVPVTRAIDLQTGEYYANAGGTALVSEGNANNSGPRMYFIDTEYLYPVFHDEMYFAKQEITKHHNVWDTYVCPVATWHNLFCTSLRRQGILSPSTDLYTTLYS